MKNTALKNRLIVWFKEVAHDDIPLVGGKGANLGEMTQAGFPVPNGFILTSNAYYHYVKVNKLQDKIKQALSDFDRHQPDQLFAVSKAVKKIIKGADFPQDLAKEVFNYYERLQSGLKDPYVAVRSSATAEDLPDASFAGQQETYLNVKGEATLIEKIKSAYASLFTPRAIFYREEKGFDHFQIGIAVPIQKMVESEISGVMFTVDPVTNEKSHIIVEAIWGLGEFIVQGTVTPDQYIVDKTNLKILKKGVEKQTIQMLLKQNKNITAKVSKSKQKKIKLSDKQIQAVAKLGKKVHQHYFFPQDIEWSIEENKLYLLQTRPITTLKATDKENKKIKKKLNLPLICQGDGASPGMATGYTVFVRSPKEISKVKTGNILVTSMTSPDFVPAMKKAAGIITDKGGLTSHAAIVSRELGVPCVVGTKNGTKKIPKKKVITLNGSTGEVFLGGSITPEKHKTSASEKLFDKTSKASIKQRQIKTATKIYVNLADPETAKMHSAENVDGIGLLRAEFIMAQLKDHPKKVIAQKKEKEYVNKLTESLLSFCKSFNPRPVIYRSADFKTNEYVHLRGGDKYEPKEENPMLGFRGVTRYLKDEEVFELELKAIKNVRNKHQLKNLWVMLPFVRTTQDLKAVKKLMAANGLMRSPSFKLFMMCEIPSNVILLDDFIKVGIDGVSIGSNDLTMLTLGVDRDNENLSSDYTEMDPAVLASLEKIVKGCHKHKIMCSICGEAPSNYPELVDKLVQWGIYSISVSPDVINKTRQLVAQAEHKRVNK